MCSGRYFGAVSLLKEETRNCICHSPAPCPDCLNGECFEACYFPRPQLHFRPSAFCALRAHPLSWFPDQLNQLFFEACCLPSSHFKIVKKSSLDMTVSVHEGPPPPPHRLQAQSCLASAQSSTRVPGVDSTLKTAPAHLLAQTLS